MTTRSYAKTSEQLRICPMISEDVRNQILNNSVYAPYVPSVVSLPLILILYGVFWNVSVLRPVKTS